MVRDEPQTSESNSLKIDLDTLELGVHEREVDLDAAWIREILAATDASVAAGGRAKLELTVQADRTVLVRGELDLRYRVPCARCLEPAVVDVGAEAEGLCVTYVPAERLRSWAEYTGAPEDEDEIEPLEPSELDEIGYEGSTLDLGALIAEQVLLAYPMRALCSAGEDCLGLCMRCGAELNSARGPDGAAPTRCPSCEMPLSGEALDEPSDSPWKQALAKAKDELDED